MKQLLYIILVLFFAGCNLVNDDGIHFKMVNKTDKTITNIKFYTTEKLEMYKLPQLQPGKSAEDFLSMSKNKIDGAYVIEYTDHSGEQIVENGYYTNGSALEQLVLIEFEKDSVLYTFTRTADY